MRKKLNPVERLIVAADNVDVLDFADKLKGTGVCIKVNSVLRRQGYQLIKQLHDLGLQVFADLKLNDIPETMEVDGKLLNQFAPDMLTVMCSVGKYAMTRLKLSLPFATEVLGVTVLTSLGDADSARLFGCTVQQGILRFAREAKEATIDGVISSAREAGMLRGLFGEEMSINSPAIRPSWSLVAGDDQDRKRIVTPSEAILLGVDRIIVGRPIIRAADPREAVMRTIEEIEIALAI